MSTTDVVAFAVLFLTWPCVMLYGAVARAVRRRRRLALHRAQRLYDEQQARANVEARIMRDWFGEV